jgi:hypothetical protein
VSISVTFVRFFFFFALAVARSSAPASLSGYGTN